MAANVLSTQVGCSFKSDDSPCKGQDYYGNEVIVEKLESCRSDIQSYLIKYGISGVEDTGCASNISELDLILNRSGRFGLTIDQRNELSICSYHRQRLSTHWPGCRRFTCFYPEHEGKKGTLKHTRRVTLKLSENIFRATSFIVPVGSGNF